MRLRLRRFRSPVMAAALVLLLTLGGVIALAAPAGATPRIAGKHKPPSTTVTVTGKHHKQHHHHHHKPHRVGTTPPSHKPPPPPPPPPPPAPAPAPAPVVPAPTPVTVGVPTPAPSPKTPVHHVVHHHKVVHHKKVAHRHKPAKPYTPPPSKPAAKPPPPKPSSLPNQVKVIRFVATPSALKFKLGSALLAVVAGGFLILMLAFPAELFNKTYEENQHEIHGVFTRMGLRRYHLPPVIGMVAFVLVGTALTAWLALGEGSDGNPVAVAVGLLIAIPLVNFAWELPVELYSRRRSKIPGELRVLPTALLVGLLCAFLSRALKLHPAYLYGVFAGFTAARAGALTKEHSGKAVLYSAIMLAVLGIGCWFAWGALAGQAEGPHRTWPTVLLATAFFWAFVLAAEALVFGLVPLDYLHGKHLRHWRPWVWLGAQLLAAAFFVYVQVLHGETEKVSDLHELIRPLIFFVIFGALSFAFWGYFHWKKRPTAGYAAEEGEVAAAAPPEGTPGIAT